MIELIEAKQFHSFTQSGYSRPARVTCSRVDGSKVHVYVKFGGAVRNREFGLTAEVVCSLLARELGLETPRAFLVNVSPAFLAAAPIQAQDLIRRSLGINFGTERAPAGFSVVPQNPTVPPALRSLAAEIFAFDVIVQNYDRKTDNPNLLWSPTKILVIDHEGALGSVLRTAAPSQGSLELDKFYDHVFYAAISPEDADYSRLAEAIGHVSNSLLKEMLGEVPSQWQVKEDLAKVEQHLLWVVENRSQICSLIRERLS